MKSIFPSILAVFLWVAPTTTAPAQNRTWTNVDGRKITARAVGKDDKSVRLRLSDGKRVSVPLAGLSLPDREWIKEWKLTEFTIKARMVDFKGRFGVGVAREFKFQSGPTMSAVIFEDEIPAFIKAIHQFFELAKKVTPDVTEHKKVLHEGKAHGSTNLWALLVFEVQDGKVRCNGGKLKSEDGRKGMKPAELMQLLDFLEGFSVEEWERQQEKVRLQFE